MFDPDRTAHGDAVALLWYHVENAASTELVASITSLKDAYYILSRLYKDKARARRSIEELMGTFVKPADMLSRYGSEALASDEPDFEDGLIRACAEHEGSDVIITRDASAFHDCPVPAMPAGDFLAREGFSYEEIDWYSGTPN